MKFKYLLLVVFSLGACQLAAVDEVWTVGMIPSHGKPVVYKSIAKLPPASVRKDLPWLAVISWKYDESTNNGMPLPDTNESMVALEDALEDMEGENVLYRMVYTATGNNLKDFAFYIKERDEFMQKFNEALSKDSVYPLEINFYEDKEWTDVRKLIAHFNSAEK